MKLSRDEIVTALQRDYGLSRELADRKAREMLGEPPIEQARARPSVLLPLTIRLPWSALCSDNEKCEAKGDRHVLKSRYKTAKEAAAAIAQRSVGDFAPIASPVAIRARVYVPDRRVHDIANFLKCCHDALEGVVYKNDAQLCDVHWTRAGVDGDAPRAELTISLYAE